MGYMLIVIFLTVRCLGSAASIERTFEYYHGANLMAMVMGTPRKITRMSIDLESNVTRITQQGYSQTQTRREIKGDTIFNKGSQIECIENEDIAHFEPGIQLTSFQFYVTDNDELFRGNYGSAIAFAYSISNHNHSLTHLFKENGLIDALQFTMRRENSERGLITFGQVDYHNQSNAPCEVNGLNGNWDCDIDNVVFGNYTTRNKSNVFNNKYSSFFSTTTEDIKAPKEFYDYFLGRSFQEDIGEGRCHLDKKLSRSLRCNCSAFDRIETLSLTINNTNFTFTPSELYYRVNNECVLVISQNPVDVNQWILGIRFLSKYIVTFSYEKSQVIFYSEKPFIELHDNSPHSLNEGSSRIIIITVSLVLSFVLVCLVYSKCKLLRRERGNQIEVNEADYQQIKVK